MEALRSGEHFGKIECIKDFKTRETATKTVYVDLITPISLVISSGFFEADHRSIVDAKVAVVKRRMFNDMLIAVMAVFVFGVITSYSIHYTKLYESSLKNQKKVLSRSSLVPETDSGKNQLFPQMTRIYSSNMHSQ